MTLLCVSSSQRFVASSLPTAPLFTPAARPTICHAAFQISAWRAGRVPYGAGPQQKDRPRHGRGRGARGGAAAGCGPGRTGRRQGHVRGCAAEGHRPGGVHHLPRLHAGPCRPCGPRPRHRPRPDPGGNTPRLEYDVTLLTPGEVTVWAHLSPRNPALGRPGLRYAVSFDDQPPQTVDVIAATGPDDGAMNHRWERHTSDHVNRTSTRHPIDRPGVHRLRFWMVDPTVVLQRLIVDTGGLCPRPASARRRATASADARNPGPPANTPAARQEPPPLNAPAAAITKGNRERPCSSTSAPPPPQPRCWSAAPC
ncbi:hypothetical protein ACFQE4_19010 [Streptomyces thermocoprophilus]|uniref:hypothetical protein n=1 Tax=Streptomyces thermocoprophilus TaxID=78356 RepID=UPI00361AA6A2